MDSSTIILWTGPFPVAGCLVSFYYYSVLYKVLYLTKHSVDPDQMPRFAASDLVYTVCQCPFCGAPGINRLSCQAHLQQTTVKYFFYYYFSEKKRLDISYQTIRMPGLIFSEK